ncbi:ArnT family glycosyltransferase [Bizionia myxarmorum]|uniref:Phospholipid carrier-dependent glycosyltransferase n=1 Tax=Bizionia myxarmorum TaxID=291186 RepID=A0A5D0R604_9FLAO|nr:glycosyltransferase family 39 protein [Bizionia myxarmorum]TYB76972.1 phospholipid carrier-dependent glycosyltransferase [Bizionia myxarmorum]
MFSLLKKYPIPFICLGIALVLLPNLHIMDVTIMEARNFVTAREMLTDNNWLLTTMNGEARYEKPPLPTWLTAISAAIFGVNSAFAMRLPAVIFIMIIAVYVFKLSKKITDSQSFGMLAAISVTTSFYVIGIIIEAPWDIFTHGFMCVAIYYLFCFFEAEKTPWKSALLAGVFIGFSILSKGPVSFYALLLPFLLAYGFTFKYRSFINKLVPSLIILILALAVGGWWYLYVRLEDPTTFLAIAEKETGNWSSYNVRPFYYYWSFFTQSGLWTIPAFISLLYPYLKIRVRNLKAYQFSLLWTILAVILLSLIPEKKSRYLMPVLIPLAINFSFYLDYLIREFKKLTNKRETIPVYFNFGLIGLIGIAFPMVAYVFLRENLEGYWIYYILASVFIFALGILIFRFLFQKDMKFVIISTMGLYAMLLLTALPLKEALNSKTFHPIETGFTGDLKLYQFNYIAPEMIWEYGDKIPQIKNEDGSIRFPEESNFGLLAVGISAEDSAIIQNTYTVEKVNTFNLNTVSEGSNQYKDRLIATYYKLTKK